MQRLFLFFLVLLVVGYVRRVWQARPRKDAPPASEVPRGEGAETVRECALCGVLVPESEGVLAKGDFYCSAEHARSAGHSV